MAEAVIAIRAVDSTRQAFTSVRQSLKNLEEQTKGISKITKLAFGGEAILGALNMMKQRLDKVVDSGEQMGFDDQQIATALQFEAAINGVLNLLMQVPLALAKVGIEIKNAFSPLTSEEIAAQIAKLRFDRTRKEIDATVISTRNLQQQFDDLGLSEGQLADKARADSIRMFKDAIDLMAKNPAEGFKKQEEALARLVESKKADAKITEQIKAAQEELNKTLPEAQRIGLSQADLIAGLRTRYAELTGQISQLNIALETYKEYGGPIGSVQDSILAKTKEQTAVSSQLNKLIEEQGRFAKEAGDVTAKAFEDAVIAGGNLRDMIRGLAQDLLRLIMRQQITEPLARALGASSFFASIFGGPRANGGPVGAGKAYMVGERGPELFVPNSSGSIMPNDQLLAESGNGTNVTINYHISSGISRTELAPILESERKRLKAEIPDMVRRGGAYRAAFA